MITKQEVVEMLSEDNDIMNYEQMRSSMMSGKLSAVSQDSVLRCMIKALSAYDKLIQKILKELDVIDKPTETASL